MKDRRLRISLYILFLCTACGPVALPATEPSVTRVGTQTAPAVLPTGTSRPVHPSPTPMFEGIIDSLATDTKGTLYAGGYGASVDGSRHLAQWDGAAWTPLGVGVNSAGSSALVTDSAGQLYTTMITDPAQGSATALVRWEGTGWEDITGDFSTVVDALQAGRISSNIPVEALALDGEDNLYAAGSFQYPSPDNTQEWPMGFVAMWDQETWTVLGQGFDQVHLYSMAVSADGKVYVSGEQPRIPADGNGPAGFLAEWDGQAWTEIGRKELNSCTNIRNLALDKAGGLYGSCIRSETGELIFHWDGTDWTTITDGLQGEAPAVYDMAVEENGHLYIGGSFDSVSGIPARNIASWDGNGWHALGDGLKGQVYSLAFDPGGDLYAAGLLTGVEGQYAGRVAHWNGKTWHTLGP